ncbi:MAG: AMP-binding protein, partial [Anaerolineae bacterium]|nr:AMP-binding protein [Anaerolineae bacterium]
MVTYADRPWTKKYDQGVPASLKPYPATPLHNFLTESARSFPNNPALVTNLHLPVLGRVDSKLNYANLDKLSDALAAALVDMGLKKGDRVALVLPNTAAFVIGFYATLKAGGVVAATNPTYPPEKLQYQINDCGAEFVVAMSLFYKTVKKIQPKTKVKHVIVTNVKEFFPAAGKLLFTLAKEKKDGHRVETLADGDMWLQDIFTKYGGRKPNVDVKPDDLALFQYTGGTTGVSKAAMATHSALVANTLQMKAVLQPTNNEVFLGAIPMFHVFGMVAVLSVAIHLG